MPTLTYSDTDVGASAFSSKATKARAYVTICHEIDVLYEAIRTWEERYNSLNITARLPPEILSTIFEIVAQPIRDDSDVYAFDKVSLLQRTRLTYVCSHWRRVALDCPNLWSYIYFPSPLTNLMLERSKLAPLTAVQCLRPHLYTQVLEPMCENMFRIRDFSVYYRKLDNHDAHHHEASVLILGTVHSAPLLETCNINLEGKHSPLSFSDSFLSDAPRLRSLQLRHCRLSSRSSVFPALTHLWLSNTGYTSWGDFRGVLAKLPHLEDIYLSHIFDVALVTNESVGPKALPNLHTIKVKISTDQIYNGLILLRNLIYPSTAIFTLKIAHLRTVDARYSFRDICILLGERLGPILRLALVRRSTGEIYLRMWNRDTFLIPPQSLLPPLKIEILPQMAESQSIQTIQDVFRSLPLQSLKSFEDRNMSFTNDWATALGSLEMIENILIFYSHDRFELLEALTKFTRPDNSCPLAMLRRLVFRECTLVPDCAQIDQLKSFLLDRRERGGAPLQELYLRKCLTTDTAVEELRTLVGKVNWDGHRGG